ncbi:hypothetical protein B0H19DRAFT_1201822, partial [Mycena capillaripes]
MTYRIFFFLCAGIKARDRDAYFKSERTPGPLLVRDHHHHHVRHWRLLLSPFWQRRRACPPPTAAERKYDQIVSELGPPAAMDTKSPLEKLVSMAKFFPHGVNPFLDIGLVIFYGSDALGSTSLQRPEQHYCDPPHHTDAFEKIVAISPDSIDVLREFYKDDAQWGRLVSKFREASKGARQHDTSGLKGKTKYLPSDPTKAIVPAL